MNYFMAGPTPPWRGGFAVPKEWSESGTPEGRWRKVVFGRVSQKIYGRAGKSTVQNIKKMKWKCINMQFFA